MTHKADHPRERVFAVRVPPQPDGIEPLQVLQRTDGRYIVYDERLPFGARTAWLSTPGASLEAAQDAARQLAGIRPLFAVHTSAGQVPATKGTPWTRNFENEPTTVSRPVSSPSAPSPLSTTW